jgi:hypothetical protein
MMGSSLFMRIYMFSSGLIVWARREGTWVIVLDT